MFTVSKESQLKFYETFGKTENSVQEDVEIIKKWLQNQRHLPEIMEDVKIQNFLNMNKFSIERTKQKIDMYYTMRTIAPEMFFNPNSINFEKFSAQVLFSVQPVLIDDRHRAYFVSFEKKIQVAVLDQLLNLFLAFYEIRLKEDFIMDDLVIVDWKNMTLNTITLLTPSYIQKFLNVYQKIYSMRMYKLVYINAPSYISNIVAMLKTVLQPKIFDRVQVHKDDAILKEIFPKELVPSDFGGNGLSLKTLADNLKTGINKHQDRFDLLDTLKVDEALRAEKLNNDELLGYYGNFKKINVD